MAVEAPGKSDSWLVRRIGEGRRAVEDDAAADGIGRGWAWAGFWLPMAGLAGLGVVFVVHRIWYYDVQLEDRPVEWAQFAMCLFSGIAFALAGVRFGRRGQAGPAVLLLLVALGSLGLAGEEISWGQRVFGVVTPAELAGVNEQAEMNVHNIDTGIPSEALFKIFAFAMGLGGAGLALLLRRPGRPVGRPSWWLVAPPLLAVPGFVGMALYRVFMLFAPVIDPVVAGQEWIEAGLYGSLAVTAGCCWARSAPGRYDLRDGATGRPTAPATSINRLPLGLAAAGVLALTVVFDVMTAHSGVLPGNLPGHS